MKTIESKRNELARAENLLHMLPTFARAQISVLFALAAVTLVGVMALGADIGVLYYNWGQLQKAADAAAEAGAEVLPNNPTDTSAAAAVATAKTYATYNGVLESDIVSAAPINGQSQMQVTIKRTVPYSFARVLGLTNGLVQVSAIARPPMGVSCVNCSPTSDISNNGVPLTSGGVPVPAGSGAPGSGVPFPGTCPTGSGSTGAFNVLPIALDNKTPWVKGSTQTLTQQDVTGNGANSAWPDAPGNWGYVNLCGNSSSSGSVLRNGMANGYSGELGTGNYLTTVPGQKSGPVVQGLQERAPTTMTAPITSFSDSDPRVVIVPIVNFGSDAVSGGSCTGVCNVTITGFMAVYILSVNGQGVMQVEDISAVVPNSVAAATAVTYGAMGDVELIH